MNIQVGNKLVHVRSSMENERGNTLDLKIQSNVTICEIIKFDGSMVHEILSFLICM